MPRRRQPSSAASIESAFAASVKNSAGPPMPNDVREASGSPWRTPGSSRSHLRLDPLRQLIAQLSDIACAHQKKDVAGAHKAFEPFACSFKRAHVHPVRNHVG